MKKIWEVVDEQSISSENKNRIFLLINMIAYGICGGVVWLLAGRFYFAGLTGLLCFIGYPAIIIGFFGGILYIYNHEFA